jgi:hypothetical protein
MRLSTHEQHAHVHFWLEISNYVHVEFDDSLINRTKNCIVPGSSACMRTFGQILLFLACVVEQPFTLMDGKVKSFENHLAPYGEPYTRRSVAQRARGPGAWRPSCGGERSCVIYDGRGRWPLPMEGPLFLRKSGCHSLVI